MSESKAVIAHKSKPTPMIAQYLSIKKTYPDYILFYQMGDFYEMFFEDAVTAAEVLKITLTKRGQYLGKAVSMCGVPLRSYEHYLKKLVEEGLKVAICKQVDKVDSKDANSNKLVQREVVRLVTPGTLTEENVLNPTKNNYIVSLVSVKTGDIACARADISTGEFTIGVFEFSRLVDILDRSDVREVLLSKNIYQNSDMVAELRVEDDIISVLSDQYFDFEGALSVLKKHFEIVDINGLGQFSRAEVIASGALVLYAENALLNSGFKLSRPARFLQDPCLLIDNVTRRSLELIEPLHDNGTALIKVIDLTRSSAGARLLASRILEPSFDVNIINNRLDELTFFYQHDQIKSQIRNLLSHMPDMARVLARILIKTCGPRDLRVLLDGMEISRQILDILCSVDNKQINSLLVDIPECDFNSVQELTRALLPHVSTKLSDGPFVKHGYCNELDEALRLQTSSEEVLEELQQKYQDLSGVKNLKIRRNNIIGVFLEVSVKQADIFEQKNLGFVRRQKLINSVRFSNSELIDLEQQLVDAEVKVDAIQREILNNLCNLVALDAEIIRKVCEILANIDVASSLAELASTRSYIRPIVDNTKQFLIEEGRHPVVEESLNISGGSFVTNNCELLTELNEAGLWVITGPNMGGKSTFLRQNALITILAQAGSYVPAKKAHIGCADKIFSRIGASDDLASGRSTFLVEMSETASILNQATDNSIVIMDEVGRGTSTLDGVSIAMATIEHLHDKVGARGLFATHFHELTESVGHLPRLKTMTLAVKHWKDKVYLLHKIIPGAADKSYGIEVAAQAGIPKEVVARSREILRLIEAKNSGITDFAHLTRQKTKVQIDDKKYKYEQQNIDEILKMLGSIQPDEISPREAIEILFNLKVLLK